MKKPNLFIVGAAKAGTTSLYHYLNQHDDVYMSPIKEPHYFSKDIRCKNFNKKYQEQSYYDLESYFSNDMLEKKHSAYNIDSLDDYLKLYKDVDNKKIVGESSVGYLYSDLAAEEIKKFNEDAKIVIVLRDPIERAFSHWMMDLRSSDVYRKNFIGAIEEDLKKEKKGWGISHLYIELGLYYEQVKRYLNVFPKENVLILMYDGFKKDSTCFFKEIFDFLEIKTISTDFSTRYNTVSIPKYPVLNVILKKLNANQLLKKLLSKISIKKIKKLLFISDDIPILTQDDRKKLMPYFRDDIRKLELLIDKDLSSWLK